MCAWVEEPNLIQTIAHTHQGWISKIHCEKNPKKQPDTTEYMECNSIYIKFKNETKPNSRGCGVQAWVVNLKTSMVLITVFVRLTQQTSLSAGYRSLDSSNHTQKRCEKNVSTEQVQILLVTTTKSNQCNKYWLSINIV